MIHLATVKVLLEYSDWATIRILGPAAALSDEHLDRPLEIGPGTGSLRRILTHTWAGEDMWLRRQRGDGGGEAKWPNENEKLSVAKLRGAFEATWRDRTTFLGTLKGPELGKEQNYRDSKGTLYRTTLGDMLMQGIMHSTHHRAQAVNALRRLGAAAPELDYMMRIRKPA